MISPIALVVLATAGLCALILFACMELEKRLARKVQAGNDDRRELALRVGSTWYMYEGTDGSWCDMPTWG
jgi:hypothetical protein